MRGEPMETHCACGFAWVASIRYSVAYSGTVEWSNGIPENIKATVRSASVPFWLQKLEEANRQREIEAKLERFEQM